jgi:hypothetical protein
MAGTKVKRRVPESEISSRARLALILTVAITFALYMIPHGEKIAYPLLLISTMVHELGHGVAAIMVGGDFEKFVMYWDGSGMAVWNPTGVGKLGHAIVSAGGLIGPAVCAGICFVLARRPSRARICLGAFGFILVIAEIFVVRNGFGLAFVGICAALCLVIAFAASEEVNQFALVFLAVQLALSVYARGDYLFMESAGITSEGLVLASDVKHMEMALGLPYWFWGGLCAAISAAVLLFGGWYFIRPSGAKTKKKPASKLKF